VKALLIVGQGCFDLVGSLYIQPMIVPAQHNTPDLFMIAGPNGAGKTTAAMRLLPDFLSVFEFVNADEIARGLNPLNAADQSLAAGRLMLERMDNLIEAKKSFAFETTGASHVFAHKMEKAKKKGYRLGLLYLWLPNVDMAIKRVENRVRLGGNDIPAEDIERRYGRSLKNLLKLYLPLVHEANIYDSTKPTAKPQLIAGKVGDRWQIVLPELWAMIEHEAKEAEHDADT
jgi:predicted ABC-type ATPase